MSSSKIERLRNTKDKPAIDDQEESKESVKAEETTKVVDLTQESKLCKLCRVQESKEASTGWKAGNNTEWVQIFSFTHFKDI